MPFIHVRTISKVVELDLLISSKPNRMESRVQNFCLILRKIAKAFLALPCINAVARYCDALDLGLRPKAFVLNSLKLLISAESVVHGVDYNHVRLHETGSLDTVADLVGTAIAMKNLNLFNSKIFLYKRCCR